MISKYSSFISTRLSFSSITCEQVEESLQPLFAFLDPILGLLNSNLDMGIGEYLKEKSKGSNQPIKSGLLLPRKIDPILRQATILKRRATVESKSLSDFKLPISSTAGAPLISDYHKVKDDLTIGSIPEIGPHFIIEQIWIEILRIFENITSGLFKSKITSKRMEFTTIEKRQSQLIFYAVEVSASSKV